MTRGAKKLDKALSTTIQTLLQKDEAQASRVYLAAQTLRSDPKILATLAKELGL